MVRTCRMARIALARSMIGSALAAAAALTLTAACARSDRDQRGEVPAGAGVVQIDGSSTVFLISQAVAEEWQKARGGRVTVGVSGTGGGFKKFCRGEIAIVNASRPIRKAEAARCSSAGIAFIELPVALDGLAVVVNRRNDWVDHFTVEELRLLWEPDAHGRITRWSQVRRGWPDREIHLFGPGVDSGTYDYFTQAVVGREHASRGDFTSSEDDNVLVQGVSSDPAALGLFGFAYYAENADELRLVAIDDGIDQNGGGPVLPSPATIANGTYQPLSRPVFIYVSTREMSRPEVKSFIQFYLDEGPALIEEVGYIPLSHAAYELIRERYDQRKTGSAFRGSTAGFTVSAVQARG